MRIINSKKSIICLIKKLNFDPDGYVLIAKTSCLKCKGQIYVYGTPNTKQASSHCPHCDEYFEIIIF